MRGVTFQDRFDFLMTQSLMPKIFSEKATSLLNMDGNRGKSGIKDTKLEQIILGIISVSDKFLYLIRSYLIQM